MAITAAERPLVIISGFITKSENRYGYDRDARRRTDELVGYTATVAPSEGAPLQVRFAREDGPVRTGDAILIFASVQESREYGTYLHFERHLSADDLENVARDTLQPSKAA